MKDSSVSRKINVNFPPFYFKHYSEGLLYCCCLTGIQLIYNVMLVSSTQQSESVMHISTLFQILSPYGSLQSIEQSPLCYTIGPHCCCSVDKPSPTLCDLVDCCIPGFPVLPVFWSLLKLMVLINYLFCLFLWVRQNENFGPDFCFFFQKNVLHSHSFCSLL